MLSIRNIFKQKINSLLHIQTPTTSSPRQIKYYVSRRPTYISVPLGSSVTLKCPKTPLHFLTIQWKKLIQTKFQVLHLQGSTKTFEFSTMSDQGRYRCVFPTLTGKYCHSFILIIQANPLSETIPPSLQMTSKSPLLSTVIPSHFTTPPMPPFDPLHGSTAPVGSINPVPTTVARISGFDDLISILTDLETHKILLNPSTQPTGPPPSCSMLNQDAALIRVFSFITNRLTNDLKTYVFELLFQHDLFHNISENGKCRITFWLLVQFVILV